MTEDRTHERSGTRLALRRPEAKVLADSQSPRGSRPDRSRRSFPWRVAIEGARSITPMAIGVLPLAITIGVVLLTSTLSTQQALASGPIILAGTSQLAALQMLAAGAAPHMIVLSAIMLNLRILLYGAAFAPAQVAGYAIGPSLLAAADTVAVLAPLALVGLVAKSTTNRPTSMAAAAAALCAGMACGLPSNGGLPLATVIGIALGAVVETTDGEHAS